MAEKSRRYVQAAERLINRFFFVQGRFFILYRSRSRQGITLLLGPGRFG